MLRKVFSHSLIYSIGPQIPKLVGLLILPLITPFLTSVDYGIWGTVMAYTGALAAIKDLGLFLPMLNAFYKHPRHWKWIWRQVHGILIFWSVIFCAIQSAILYVAIPSAAQGNVLQIILLTGIPVLIFDIPIMLGNRYFQLSGKPVIVSVASAISGIATLAISYITIAIFKMGYMGWFVSSFIGSFALFLIFVYPVYFKLNLKPIFYIKKRFLTNSLKIGLPIIPHNYSAYLLNASDRMVMSWYSIPTRQIGLYNIAYIWGNYVDLLGSAVGMAVGPFYLSLYAEKSEKAELQIKKLTYLLQILFLSGCFLMSLWIKEIFYLFIKNAELQNAYYLAVVIIMSYAYYPMYWTVINRLQFHEYTNKLWRITAIGGLINLSLNLILIPVWGFQVAVYTTFLSMMYIAFSGFQLKEFKQLQPGSVNPILWFSLITTATVLAFILKDINTLNKSFVTLLVLITSGFCLRYVNKWLK